MSVKSSFSIKELENLSGVKAHTIRIWEKRYGLLQPERSNTNIRTYDLDNLKKLLNISLLNGKGIKVSKIAQLSEQEILEKVKEESIETRSSDHAINEFKLAMLNFDQDKFDQTYSQVIKTLPFQDVFETVFFKLLEDIGTLWVTETITPSHEHFISTLITQKLLLNIEAIDRTQLSKDKTFVLFLPLNEIHELGLLYVHYHLMMKGYKSVYLGPNVPVTNLLDLQKVFPSISYVSYFTVSPSPDKVEDYLLDIQDKILRVRNEKLYLVGRNTQHLDPKTLHSQISLSKDLKSLVKSI